MTLAVISDIHGAVEKLAAMAQKLVQSDILLIAGDLTEFGGAEVVREMLALLEPARGRIVAVPGNCDRKSARDLLLSEGLSADGRLVERAGVLIAGSGGGLMRTGLTPYEREDEELGSSLETALAALGRRDHGEAPLVILSHTPPRDSAADRHRGASLGSQALRRILDRIEPPLWICGHIHESRCVERLGRTLVLNPGPLAEGFYALALLERDGKGLWRAEAELGA